jgi:hypothetical protein
LPLFSLLSILAISSLALPTFSSKDSLRSAGVWRSLLIKIQPEKLIMLWGVAGYRLHLNFYTGGTLTYLDQNSPKLRKIPLFSYYPSLRKTKYICDFIIYCSFPTVVPRYCSV